MDEKEELWLSMIRFFEKLAKKNFFRVGQQPDIICFNNQKKNPKFFY
jgi:hypothetical protein